MLRNVEVCDIDTLFLGYQDIARFNIPMANSLFVQVCYTLQDLSIDLTSISFIIAAHACDRVENFMTFNKLHHLVDFVFKVILKDFDCTNNILMLKAAQDLKFIFMSPQFLVVIVSYDFNSILHHQRVQ